MEPRDVSAPPPHWLPPPPSRWLQRPRRKKLLVLDVNGLLCWRAPKGKSVVMVDDVRVDLATLRPPDGTAAQFHVWLRPYAREFVAWCAERFELVVWSTATARNLEPLVELVFAGHRPMAVLNQSHCTNIDVTHPDDEARPLYIKELAKMWADQRIAAAAHGLLPHSAEDTLLLDDSPYKALANPQHTALHPLEWRGPADSAGSGDADGALAADGPLRAALAWVATATSVPQAVRTATLDAAHWTSANHCAITKRALAKRPDLARQQQDAVASSPIDAAAAATAQLLGMLGVS